MKGNKYIREKSKRQFYGEVVVDAAKLIFGSVVLGAVLRMNADDFVLVLGGIVFCLLLVVCGVFLIYK